MELQIHSRKEVSQGEAAVRSMKSQRSGHLWERFRGLAQDKLSLPVVTLGTGLIGAL